MGSCTKVSAVVLVVAVVAALIYPRLGNKGPPLTINFNVSYDYVIVGGGAAGSTLAGRLAEDGRYTVLLLEAGGSDWGSITIDVPLLGAFSVGSEIDWGYKTDRQDGLMGGFKDEVSHWPSGKVLGGSGSINAMVITRGARTDYDRWASYTGDEAWDFRHMLPYFRRLEDMRIERLKDSAYHGIGGPIPITHSKASPLADKLLEAGREFGYHDNKDYNGENQEGVFRVQSNVLNGRRVSTSRAYLHPAMRLHNLHVVVNAHVTKVLLEKQRAVGVEFVRDGRKERVRSKREVILSAGTVGSPKVLMLSGIGPRNHLEKLQIPVVANLPVGANLQDHLMVDVPMGISEPMSWTHSQLLNPLQLLRYFMFGTGPFHIGGLVEVVSFHSMTSKAKEQRWPDLQINFVSIPHATSSMKTLRFSDWIIKELAARDETKYGFICLPSVLRPESRGNVTLASADPLDHPRISPNYLSEDYDVDIMVKGIQFCKELIKTNSLKSIGARHMDTKPVSACKHHEFESREYWACVIKLVPSTVYHSVGTCKMGPDGDPTAVVDSQLRVRGLSGLRVVDASIMPWVTSGNTHIPTIAIAERAVDWILENKPLPPQDVA